MNDGGALKRRTFRHGRRVATALIAAAVIAGTALAIAGCSDQRAPDRGDAVGAVPVWYDADGLHRGDVVERTPVELGQKVGADTLQGALALVRSGAVYADPATHEVWFHPWGGKPRIVGHDSEAGPGGDPNGDTAAWFERSDALNTGPGELVVYNTAEGREISRTEEAHGTDGAGGDHYPAGNGFRQVSAERVVWTAGPQMFSHEVRVGRTTVMKSPEGRWLVDVHDDVEALGERSALVVRVPGRAEKRYPELETHARLSPSGRRLLAVEGTDARHAATITDTRTGQLWPVPKNAYPWIAWSYGDIAMVDTEDALLACDATRQKCEQLPAKPPLLMPTN